MAFPPRPDVPRERFHADPLGIAVAILAVAVFFLFPLVPVPGCSSGPTPDRLLAFFGKALLGFSAAQVLGTFAVARCAPASHRRGLLIATGVGAVACAVTGLYVLGLFWVC